MKLSLICVLLSSQNTNLTRCNKTVYLTHNGTTFTVTFQRIGPVVIATSSGVIDIKESDKTTNFEGTVPEGYKPNVTGCASIALVSGSIQSGTMRVLFNTNGIVSFVASINGRREVYFCTLWVTNDDFPI